MSDRVFTIEFYEDGRGRRPVVTWLERDLDLTQRAALVAGLQVVLARRGIDVCASEWGKPLGDGLYEFRIRHTAVEIAQMFGESSDEAKASAKVLLRVFFHPHGDRIVLLLGGYDKGADPSDKRQEKEIKVARKRLTDFQDRQARERKEQRRGGQGEGRGR